MILVAGLLGMFGASAVYGAGDFTFKVTCRFEDWGSEAPPINGINANLNLTQWMIVVLNG